MLCAPAWSAVPPDHGPADVTLRIGTVRVEVAPGNIVTTTGYNGTSPAPLIRLRERVPITVDIFNDTGVPEYVHWHGFLVAAELDGTAEEKSLRVPAHGHLRYRMTPELSGSRWVHSHAMAGEDLTRGLYSGQFGFVYVEPKNNPGHYDQEIFLATHEWEPFFMDTDNNNAAGSVEEFGETDWGPNSVEVGYRLASINGKALGHGEPIRVREGQRVLFHILNASATENIRLSLSGHDFLVTALDGNPIPYPRKVSLLELGVAERLDAIVEMNHPGVWILGSTDADVRGSGLGVLVEYAGMKGLAASAKPTGMPWDYTVFGADDAAPTPDQVVPMVITRIPPGPHDLGLERWTINGKSLNPEDEPMALHKKSRYRLVFYNQSTDDHPLHLHRNSFELTKVGGKPTAGIMKDVVVVKANHTVEVDFVPEQEGLTLFHCHNQFHMDRGFMKLFNVL